MSDFYMLTLDGKEVPVFDFPTTSKTSYEETFSASEWLFHNTDSETVKDDIVRFAIAYAFELDPSISFYEVMQTLSYQIDHTPYKVISPQFLDELEPYIWKYAEHAKRHPQVTIYNEHIENILAQNYLRASIGEPFRNIETNDAYFLVSSNIFCWIEQIYHFVKAHQHEIDSVTIARDPIRTALDGYCFYYKGKKLDHMPIADFLSAFEKVTQSDITKSGSHAHRWFEGRSLR